MAYPNVEKRMYFSVFFFFFLAETKCGNLVKLSIWIRGIKLGYTFMFHISLLHLLKMGVLSMMPLLYFLLFILFEAIPFLFCCAILWVECTRCHLSLSPQSSSWGLLSLGARPGQVSNPVRPHSWFCHLNAILNGVIKNKQVSWAWWQNLLLQFILCTVIHIEMAIWKTKRKVMEHISSYFV